MKSFQSPLIIHNHSNFLGFQSAFVHKSSQSNFNWVKGFVCPPFKYKPAGLLGFSFHLAFMAIVRVRCAQRVLSQLDLNLGAKVVISPDLLCARLVKHAEVGNDFFLFSGEAFNAMEWLFFWRAQVICLFRFVFKHIIPIKGILR